MTALATVINPAVPNLPLGPEEYERRFQDQFGNVLRLYFNQLNTGMGVLIDNQNTMQAEIDAQRIEIDRNLTLVWVSSGEGIFSG
jgi:hypothetical protein